MLVCHCFNVKSKQIQLYIQQGACTVKDINKKCRAGSCCGGCVPVIKELLKESVCLER